MAELHVLRVFTTPLGEHGNELGVFLDGVQVPEERRQHVAADLGFAETVFVDDRERGRIRIFTPELELPFAGHPSVGTAWLLREAGVEVSVLRPPAGDLLVRYEDEVAWIAARAEWSPPFEYLEQKDAEAVDALNGAPGAEGWAYCWASEGEDRVRARAFVTEAGIAEDEATGSAALTLCARRGKAAVVRQGNGSEIFTRPLGEGRAEVGGRVILDDVRAYEP